jgi:HPt (histidine-containing phosphotransfer) domain-containing protein
MADHESQQEALQRQMRVLATQFITRTHAEVGHIRALIGTGAQQADALPSIIMLAHKICGTASTFQFDEISACAWELERTAVALEQAPLALPQKLEQLERIAARLTAAVDGCRREDPDLV